MPCGRDSFGEGFEVGRAKGSMKAQNGEIFDRSIQEVSKSLAIKSLGKGFGQDWMPYLSAGSWRKRMAK